ncbi:MAG: hypothetical protein Q8Q11_00525 [bacterium]|nr:hypothetical protein [bacterium]MDZ4248448.1 hypothetical protein [Patescibacteria group bacterium]
MSEETITATDLAAELGIEAELRGDAGIDPDVEVDVDEGTDPDIIERYESDLAMLPEVEDRETSITLPSERTDDEIFAGQDVYAFPVVSADGTHKLIRGTVRDVTLYDFEHSSPGFASLMFREPPYRYTGVDLNHSSLIPAVAMDAFKRDPDLLERWLQDGTPEDLREVDELRDSIEAALEFHVTDSEAFEPIPVPEETSKPKRTGVRKRSVEYEIAALKDEYLERAWRDSLYAMSKKEERALLAAVQTGDRGAFDQVFEGHLGLVAFFVEQQNANGTSQELMRRGSEILRETIHGFQAVNGNRLADAVCESLDARLTADLFEQLDERKEKASEAREKFRGVVQLDPQEKPARAAKPAAESSPTFCDIDEDLDEACAVAWAGVHRSLAEASNPYMD